MTDGSEYSEGSEGVTGEPDITNNATKLLEIIAKKRRTSAEEFWQ